jgi:hypothetical protein
MVGLDRQAAKQAFDSFLTGKVLTANQMHQSLIRIEGDRFDARFDHDSLPPEEDMDRILRYEERMQRQIDWAVQRLLESQERLRMHTGMPVE